MVSIAQKLKNKITKKTFSCPNCAKSLRVPVRPGKTLKVSCPKCQGEIMLSFKSPLSDFFSWEKGRTITYNLRMFSWRFKALPIQIKLGLIVQVIIISLLFKGIFTWAINSFRPGHVLEAPSNDIEIIRTI